MIFWSGSKSLEMAQYVLQFLVLYEKFEPTRGTRHQSFNVFVTYFHQFRIYEFTFFFIKRYLFSFKGATKCLFCENKQFKQHFQTSIEKFYVALKETTKLFVKKILRLGIRKNMSQCRDAVTKLHLSAYIFIRLLSLEIQIKTLKP